MRFDITLVNHLHVVLTLYGVSCRGHGAFNIAEFVPDVLGHVCVGDIFAKVVANQVW